MIWLIANGEVACRFSTSPSRSLSLSLSLSKATTTTYFAYHGYCCCSILKRRCLLSTLLSTRTSPSFLKEKKKRKKEGKKKEERARGVGGWMLDRASLIYRSKFIFNWGCGQTRVLHVRAVLYQTRTPSKHVQPRLV